MHASCASCAICMCRKKLTGIRCRLINPNSLWYRVGVSIKNTLFGPPAFRCSVVPLFYFPIFHFSIYQLCTEVSGPGAGKFAFILLFALKRKLSEMTANVSGVGCGRFSCIYRFDISSLLTHQQ